MKILTIDGGGTLYKGITVQDGKLLGKSYSSRNVSSLKEVFGFIDQGLESGSKLRPGTKGIAIALTGVVENHDRLGSGPNSPWLVGTKLATAVRKKYDLPVHVCNDMEAAATGTLEIFRKLRTKPFWVTTLSTGVGTKFVDEYGCLPMPNAECGHFRVDYSDLAHKCACGQIGCIETFLGGRALALEVNRVTTIYGVKIPEDTTNNRFLRSEFEAGAEWSKFVCDRYATALARYLSALVNIGGGTQDLVIRGGLGQHLVPLFLDDVRSRMSVMNPKWLTKLKIHITPPMYGEDNADAFLGAEKLFHNNGSN